MTVEVEAARQRIIRRPRLTSMLDESSARVRLLVAPAGYGKTTLAREWLGEPERRDVWYRGGPASADVAALAMGVAEAASKIVPDAGSRMRDRLRATGHPEEDVDILAELFAQDVQEWPEDAWLAIDDYQFAMDSAASERFVDLMTQSTPMQLLITSRRRPTWATARRILYGEILEIDRRALAMDETEARAVIDRDEAELAAFLEVARGWPAVIGLIRLNSALVVSQDALPDQLYDYFGQELYDVIPGPDQRALAALAFTRRFDRQLARAVVGAGEAEAIEAGIRVGVVSGIESDCFEIHPLFSRLLIERAFPTHEEQRRAATTTGHVLVEAGRWDEAVELAARFRLPDILIRSLEAALNTLIDAGRTASVMRWIDVAAELQCDSPVVDLAEAEVAFRSGEHAKAEGLAAQATRRLKPNTKLLTRAYVRAGHGALLANREEESIRYFELAEKTASTAGDRREALFGLYSALSELDRPEAGSVLAELEPLELDTPDDIVRSQAISLTYAVRTGGVLGAIAPATEQLHLVDRVQDPLKRTSFLHVFSSALTIAARYQHSLVVAEKLHALTEENRLDFARPFALIDRGVARMGLRDFSAAKRDLALAGKTIGSHGDVHLEGNLAAIRGRLFLSLGQITEAAAAATTVFNARRPPAPLLAEILAVRALAQACARDHDAALRTIADAEAASPRSLDVRVLRPVVHAICTPDRRGRVDFAHAAWQEALSTGNLNGIVYAYRGCPELLPSFRDAAGEDSLGAVLTAANDVPLARRFRIAIDASRLSASPLTPREIEVMDMAASGLSNKEIAEALFISGATVKAHLRHTYEKLGVRRRSEAIARWLTQQ